MTHIPEETLARFAAHQLSESEREQAASHLETCLECRRLVEEYAALTGALDAWRDAPADAVDAAVRRVTQRVRLHRLLESLLSDASLRRQAARDPQALLTTHGITPSPQLLAAFRELDAAGRGQVTGSLDERITKLYRLLD